MSLSLLSSMGVQHRHEFHDRCLGQILRARYLENEEIPNVGTENLCLVCKELTATHLWSSNFSFRVFRDFSRVLPLGWGYHESTYGGKGQKCPHETSKVPVSSKKVPVCQICTNLDLLRRKHLFCEIHLEIRALFSIRFLKFARMFEANIAKVPACQNPCVRLCLEHSENPTEAAMQYYN